MPRLVIALMLAIAAVAAPFRIFAATTRTVLANEGFEATSSALAATASVVASWRQQLSGDGTVALQAGLASSGSRSLRISPDGASGATYAELGLSAPVTDLLARATLRVASQTSSSVALLSLVGPGGRSASVERASSGRLSLRYDNGKTADLGRALPLGKWLSVTFMLDGNSATMRVKFGSTLAYRASALDHNLFDRVRLGDARGALHYVVNVDQVLVSSAKPPALWARDSFSRSISAGWGSADIGGQYDLRGAAAGSAFSVDGQRGYVAMPRASLLSALLASDVLVSDAQIAFRFSLDSLPRDGEAWIYAAARSDGASEYRPRVILRPDGRLAVHASRVVDRVESPIGDEVVLANIRLSPGAQLSFRAEVTGASPTVISVKAWLSSSPEPVDWQYQHNDNTPILQRAGFFGLRTYLSLAATNTAPLAVGFDNYALVDAAEDSVVTPPPSPSSAPSTPFPTPPSPSPSPSPGSLRTRYVSAAGNDANAGTISAPWRTLQKAADNAVAGDLIYVRAGTYAGFSMYGRSGTSDAHIVFAAYPDEHPVLDGHDSVTWVVSLSHLSWVDLRGFEVMRGHASGQEGGGVLVTVSDSVLVADNVLHDNSAYGVRAYNSRNVIIRNNEIYGNGEGIDVRYGGEGVQILDNRVHDQDRCMTNTPDIAHDDTCAVGIGFVKSTGHVLARGNVIYGNRAPSYDYGVDGAGFEIYAASNVTMVDNLIYDNDNTLESGTDANKTPCANNVFLRNVAYGPSTGNKTVGLILRCAKDMLVAHNTIVGLTYWVYDINLVSQYSGDVLGVRIIDNINRMYEGKIYAIGSNLPLESITIDYNLDYNPGNLVASVAGKGNASTSAQFALWTGFQAHGVNADPRFVDTSLGSFIIGDGSPAIDRGLSVSPWSVSYLGAAPDIGKFERR